MSQPFVPLWCKSNYTFLEGASHPDELVESAHAHGLRALALTDRDGVADAHDLCPGEHATTSRPSDTRRGCPTADTDHDGWHDDVDACTTDPAGANPDAAHPGCPLPDRDADGIADAEDVCPTEPGGFEDALRHDCP